MHDWWESFYREADYDRCAYLAGDEMADLLARFFQRVGVPDDAAFVGCGPAVVPFALAERYPEVDVFGYDVSPDVVADNRALADERGLDNLAFAVDSLPDLDCSREFDLVYCVATLYFVADAEAALRSLYRRVRPGGHLVVNYPDETTREAAREFEGRKAEAFSLVRAGENLLTADRIGAVLDAEPRDYWRAVEAEDVAEGRWPTVYLRR